MEQLQMTANETGRNAESTLPVQTFVWNIDPSLSPRDQITKLTADMLQATTCQVEMPVKHSFARGMYIREMFIKKGSLVVGKIHRQECINICASGDISILTETGFMRVVAPFQIVSPAGMQRVGYANEDTVWINIFRTDETDIEKLEIDLVLSDAEAIALIDPTGKYFKTMEKLCR